MTTFIEPLTSNEAMKIDQVLLTSCLRFHLRTIKAESVDHLGAAEQDNKQKPKQVSLRLTDMEVAQHAIEYRRKTCCARLMRWAVRPVPDDAIASEIIQQVDLTAGLRFVIYSTVPSSIANLPRPLSAA
jgi:hypothetical protein